MTAIASTELTRSLAKRRPSLRYETHRVFQTGRDVFFVDEYISWIIRSLFPTHMRCKAMLTPGEEMREVLIG